MPLKNIQGINQKEKNICCWAVSQIKDWSCDCSCPKPSRGSHCPNPISSIMLIYITATLYDHRFSNMPHTYTPLCLLSFAAALPFLLSHPFLHSFNTLPSPNEQQAHPGSLSQLEVIVCVGTYVSTAVGTLFIPPSVCLCSPVCLPDLAISSRRDEILSPA